MISARLRLRADKPLIQYATAYPSTETTSVVITVMRSVLATTLAKRDVCISDS
ncbi:hypothetical protein D3C87_2149760 [compost metagenome]